MTNLLEMLEYWIERFWDRFSETTGWDPNPQQQMYLIAAGFAVLFLAFLLVYARRVIRESKLAAKQRDKRVANYQQMRRFQTTDDR